MVNDFPTFQQHWRWANGIAGGHLKPDSYYSISRLATEYGIDAAAEVANFESANVEAVTEFIRENKVDCDFILTRATDVQFSAEHQEKVRAGYERLLAAGVKATKGTYCAEDKHAEKVSGFTYRYQPRRRDHLTIKSSPGSREQKAASAILPATFGHIS